MLHEKRFRDSLARNKRSHWAEHAEDAIKIVAGIFSNFEIPILLGPFSLLGWFQRCGAAIQGEKVDFIVPSQNAKIPMANIIV